MAGPNQGEVYDGYRYMGGDPKSESSWQQAGPIDVSASWGAGARQLPNGTIERVGPRGGVTQIGTAEGRAGAGDDVGKLTEAQGKAVLYGSMMAGGERDYQEARRDGYNPASALNQVADFADLIPFDGGAIPRLIRNDVSDRGVQAERRFTEANLRQLSGAAVTPSEVTRTVAINFDRGNDELTDQRRRTREETYRGTRATAGSGAAAIPAFPGSEVGPTDPATGLPTYPNIAATAAPIVDATGPANFGGGPQGPGSGPDSPIDLGSLGPEDLLKLQAGQYVRRSDGTVYALPSSPFAAPAQQGDVREGNALVRSAEDRGWTPESAVAQRDSLNPILRQVDAFGRGFADMGSLEFADEIAAGGDALFGQGVGDSFGQRFRSNVAVQRAVDEDDGRDAGFARGLGEFAGGVAGAFIGGPAALRSVANIRSPLLRGALTFGRNAATGAALGGTAAAGNARGDALNRAQAFLKAAPVSAAFGAAIPAALSGGGAVDRLLGAPVARASGAISRGVSRVAGDVGSALGIPGASALSQRATITPLQSAIDQFGSRMGSRRISALGETAQGQRGVGFDPTFADLLDDGGQGSLRALATMDTPARPLAVDFGRARRVDAQTDVSNIARNFISDDPRTAARVAADLDVDQRLASGAAYSEARASAPITVSPDVGEALFSGDGPRQIRSAAQAYKSSVKPEERALALELESMAQAAEGGVPAGPVEMSVGAADLLSQYLNKAGGADANLSRIYQGLGREIRTQARNQSPEYEAALSGYAERAQLQDASNVGGRFLGRRGTQDFVNEAEAMLPAQKEVARVAARDAVEDAGNTTSGAATLLDDLSVGRGRGQRTDAFVEDAEGLRNTAEAARNRLSTGRNVDPRQGSNTFLNTKDGEDVEGAVQFLSDGAQIIANPFRGIPAVTARRLQNRGFNKDEAEAIVTAALDPAQTDTLVRMLSQRMSRREARSLARAVHRSLTSATGSSSVQ